jgi:hypothetical protein
MKLSDKAKQICKTNYKSNCDNCPLRQECTKTMSNLSHDKLNNWIMQVNLAAEKVYNSI